MSEEEKKEIENMLNDIFFWSGETTTFIKRDFYKNLIQKMYEKLDKQSKVINKMAEDRAEISEPKVSKQAIIDFYYKEVEAENE